ncbi:MAG TPA: hypothetical protein VLF17_00575 [Candidatus Nitrosotenuis sp.]|nr:hypothetical protein [Candidatus Nitrosotenuis sp.]
MEDTDEYSNHSIRDVIESFVEQIQKTRRLLFGVTISALILAPLAIGLSVYLVRHEHFFFILDEYDEFGTFLVVLLATIIIIASIWLVLGIRQFAMLKSWNSRYSSYMKKKEKLDERLSASFELDEDQ